MPNGISWNSINANFGDTASLMNAAQQGISNAGNIFNQAVSGIRDYQKMELDNAYKQRSLDESIRQFDAKFGQDADQFREKMALEADKLTQAWDIAVMQDRTNRLKAQAEMANARATRSLAAAKFAMEQQDKLDKRYSTIVDSFGSSLLNSDFSNLTTIIPQVQAIANDPNSAYAGIARAMLADVQNGFDPKTGALVENSDLWTLRQEASKTDPYAAEKAFQEARARWGYSDAPGKLTDVLQKSNEEQRKVASGLAEKKRTDNNNYNKALNDLRGNGLRSVLSGGYDNAKVVDDFISEIDTLSTELGINFSKEAALNFLVRHGVADAWTSTTNGPFDSAVFRIQNSMDAFMEAYANNEFNLSASQISSDKMNEVRKNLDKIKIANTYVNAQRAAFDSREQARKEREEWLKRQAELARNR